MTDILIPNTFADKSGTTNLSSLDANFEYLATTISSGTGGTNLDGGTPSTIFTGGAVLDCGGVT